MYTRHPCINQGDKMAETKMVPITEALVDPTLPRGVTREVAIRAVLRREVEGGRIAGRWLCDPVSLQAWLQSDPKPAA
jgi:hypothetical protein